MFKSQSFFSGWFKKPVAATGVSEKASDEPSSLVVPSTKNKHQLINISMTEKSELGDTDSFVGIEFRQLTYAEVAALSTAPETKDEEVKLTMKPTTKKSDTTEIEYDALATEYEPFKSDVNYLKSKSFKDKQTEAIQAKRLVRAKKAAKKRAAYGKE